MSIDADLCYILCFPDPARRSTEPVEQIRGLKDSPYFQPVDISVRTLEQAQVQTGGACVQVLRQLYDDCVQVVECRFSLPSILEPADIPRRQTITDALLDLLVPAEHLESGLIEEYLVLRLGGVGTPDKFVKANARRLAHFIRPQREALDDLEIEEILVSRVRYAQDDMTIVDWEGAIIITPDSDFQSDVELLKIGNYQLLRYRMLDQSVEASLRTIADQFRDNPRHALRPGPTRGQIRRIVQARLELMLDFEHTDQNLLLIGDWYTAKLYAAIREELYLDHWKESVQSKLGNMESIIHTIQENFSLSWQGLMERVELAGWIILLIGYFILFFIESGLTH